MRNDAWEATNKDRGLSGLSNCAQEVLLSRIGRRVKHDFGVDGAMEVVDLVNSKFNAAPYEQLEEPSRDKSPSRKTELRNDITLYRQSTSVLKTAELSIPEDQWESAKSTGLVFPVGPRKQVWDVLIMLLMIIFHRDRDGKDRQMCLI